MATKGEELAVEFEQANSEFMALVRNLTPEQWKAQCAGEGWSVGVVAHHVAEDHGILTDLVHAVASGEAVPVITGDYINSLNADHAERAEGCTREETLDVAQTRGAQAAAMLRGLSDEQLARIATVPVLGGEVDAARLAQFLLVGHPGMHTPSIEQAITSPV